MFMGEGILWIQSLRTSNISSWVLRRYGGGCNKWMQKLVSQGYTNPWVGSLNPKPQTLNPKPQTPNTKHGHAHYTMFYTLHNVIYGKPEPVNNVTNTHTHTHTHTHSP